MQRSPQLQNYQGGPVNDRNLQRVSRNAELRIVLQRVLGRWAVELATQTGPAIRRQPNQTPDIRAECRGFVEYWTSFHQEKLRQSGRRYGREEVVATRICLQAIFFRTNCQHEEPSPFLGAFEYALQTVNEVMPELETWMAEHYYKTVPYCSEQSSCWRRREQTPDNTTGYCASCFERLCEGCRDDCIGYGGCEACSRLPQGPWTGCPNCQPASSHRCDGCSSDGDGGEDDDDDDHL